MWDVNSKVTKQSNHYVWKDTSERMVRRCDETVDKKRVNSCVLKHLFLKRVEQPKTSPKKPEMLSPTRNWCHVFKINRAPRGFLNPRSARFKLMNSIINSGPNILRSYFLHLMMLLQGCTHLSHMPYMVFFSARETQNIISNQTCIRTQRCVILVLLPCACLFKVQLIWQRRICAGILRQALSWQGNHVLQNLLYSIHGRANAPRHSHQRSLPIIQARL